MQSVYLSGLWDVRSTDDEIQLQISVPGSLMQALEERGDFGEKGLFYRKNNRKALAAADHDYIFSSAFQVNRDFLKEERFFLECDGLDTLTTITINDIPIGSTENMHRGYVFPLNAILREGENYISISFSNTLKYITHKQQERMVMHAFYGQPDTVVPGFNRIRKSHCSYGWDWGPIIPDVGIWRDIRITGYSRAHIEQVQIRQRHHEGTVTLSFYPRITNWSNDPLLLEISLHGPEGESWLVSGPADSDLNLTIPHPQLWWPNGLGERPLYTAGIKLISGDTVLEHTEKILGLRTLEVNRSPNEWGQAFNFRCNGQDFFAMGADYIPEDIFLTRMNRERTTRLLNDAAEAHFNCIRVWGGGVYPDEYFYRLCDELGLVVWQDFMFACALYDARNPNFQENIRQEALYNAERIHHHPCLGLLCGNNEIESAITDWKEIREQAEQDPGVRDEYLLQFEDILKDAAGKAAPDTFYWPSSPSSGGGFDNPNDPDRGDCHYWDVWHGYHPFEDFEQHYFRFMSEFGYESLPHQETITSFTEPGDRDITASVMEDHQRGAEGTKKLMHYIRKYFGEPQDFNSLVYLSQVCQAEALRHGIEHWRRNRGRCMGAVYWQLNDNWPGVSWSSIDYYGRWKALHYQAKRDFQPLLLSSVLTGSTINLYISNEGRNHIDGELLWQIIDTDGRILLQGEQPAYADPFESHQAVEIDITGIPGGHLPSALLFAFQFRTQGVITHSLLEHLSPFTKITLKDPGLSWCLTGDSANYRLEITAQRPAFFVEINLVEGEAHLSDNFFSLNGRETKTIEIRHCTLLPDELERNLRIRSLQGSYN